MEVLKLSIYVPRMHSSRMCVCPGCMCRGVGAEEGSCPGDVQGGRVYVQGGVCQGGVKLSIYVPRMHSSRMCVCPGCMCRGVGAEEGSCPGDVQGGRVYVKGGVCQGGCQGDVC